MSQWIIILFLLSFRINKLSLTQLSCEETSVWFSIRATKPRDMNKIIDTSTRLFMAVVGPSGSAKTKIYFKLLKGRTFLPNLEDCYFLQRYSSYT